MTQTGYLQFNQKVLRLLTKLLHTVRSFWIEIFQSRTRLKGNVWFYITSQSPRRKVSQIMHSIIFKGNTQHLLLSYLIYHNQSWDSCLMYQTTNGAYKHIKIGEKAFNCCLIIRKIWLCGSKHGSGYFLCIQRGHI